MSVMDWRIEFTFSVLNPSVFKKTYFDDLDDSIVFKPEFQFSFWICANLAK